MSTKTDFLSEIAAAKKKEVERKKQSPGIGAVMKSMESAPPVRPFEQALSANEPPRIIAEIKRKSPSKGILIENPDVVRIAQGYASAGATAVSVLTDEPYFGGTLADMTSVRNAVNIPVLRKDFIVDEFQVYESRAAGADTLLLIVKLLGQDLGHYLELARKLGMEPLVEIHDKDETRTAIDAGARIIGINARNLRTFSVNTGIVGQIAEHIPETIYTIAESGIGSTDTISEMLKLGIDGFLIGEAFMKSESPAIKLKEYMEKFRTSSFIERR